MRSKETISIIVVEPIDNETQLRAAQEALDRLKGAEPGSEEDSQRYRIAQMIREYENRGAKALRNAGEASAEWTSEHRGGLGWLAAGAASVAAAGLGLNRWRKGKEEASVRGRLRSLVNGSAKGVGRGGKAGKAGWKGARDRIKKLT